MVVQIYCHGKLTFATVIRPGLAECYCCGARVPVATFGPPKGATEKAA